MWKDVKRLFLAVWLALFALQSGGVVLAIAPDDCVYATRGTPSDSCRDDCARCVCCHRVQSMAAALAAVAPVAHLIEVAALSFDNARATAEPRDILHVPKTHSYRP